MIFKNLTVAVTTSLFLGLWTGHSEASVGVSVEVKTKANGTTEPLVGTKDVSVTLTTSGFQRSRGTDGEGVADFGSVPTGNYNVELYLSGYFYHSRPVTITQESKLKFELEILNGIPQVPSNPPPPPPPEPAPILTSYAPTSILNGYAFNIEFKGQNFRRGAYLEYSANGGVTIATAQLVYESPTSLKVYSAGDIPAGNYQVRVKNFDGQPSGILNVTIQNNPNYVRPPLPAATINVQTCIVPYNGTTCTVSVNYSRTNAPLAGVRGIVTGTPVAQSSLVCPIGQTSCLVSLPVGSYDFGVLSDGNDINSSLLDFQRITVTKAPPPATGSITQIAGCNVPWNGSFCNSGVAWSVQNGPNAGIRVRNMSQGGIVVPGVCLTGNPCGFATTVGTFEVALIEDRNNTSSRVLDSRTISIAKDPAYAALSVTVKNTSGVAIPGAIFSLSGSAGNYSFTANANGLVSGNVNYGNYTATVSAGGYVSYVAAYSHTIASGFTVNLAPAAGTLKVCITYGGAPIANASITASGPTVGTEITNATGCTSGVPVIPYGSYSVVATGSGITRNFAVTHNRTGRVISYEVLTGVLTSN